MLLEYDTEFPFFSKASLSPQHVVTDEERVVIGRNTAPVPSPNASQVHTPTMSHTQAQLKKMRERWRNKVTLARASNRLSAAGLAEQQEEKVWWLPHLLHTCHSYSLQQHASADEYPGQRQSGTSVFPPGGLHIHI